MMWTYRYQKYSFARQQTTNSNDIGETNLAFTIPCEYVARQDLPSASLFHGGIDSPSMIAIDRMSKQYVHVTKHLCLKSRTCTQQYVNHLYERIIVTNNLSHANVHRVLCWYIADACLYSITGVIERTLRQAIESETFSLERVHRLSLQLIHGTIYLQSKDLCPLTPWYTTNIELTRDDHIRLCSPTILATKLNGGVVRQHHLWRHAPESLIRMLIEQDSSRNHMAIDNSKEDVWSIGCIIVEMMINTILFRPSNDDPALQLLCIVQYVGGLTLPIFECFPFHVKRLFSKIKFDDQQCRLNHLLRQILNQEQIHYHEHHLYTKENLYDLLKGIFQFQCDRRLSLQSLVEHPFYAMNSSFKSNDNTPVTSPMIKFVPFKSSSIRIDDLVHLCVKFNLTHSRWMLTLKERCLLELILRIKHFNQFDLNQIVLSKSLQIEIQKLIYFLTGN